MKKIERLIKRGISMSSFSFGQFPQFVLIQFHHSSFLSYSISGSAFLRSSCNRSLILSIALARVPLKLEQDKAKPENIGFTVNGTDIFDWFKQKQKVFLNSLGIRPKEKKGMKM